MKKIELKYTILEMTFSLRNFHLQKSLKNIFHIQLTSEVLNIT